MKLLEVGALAIRIIGILLLLKILGGFTSWLIAFNEVSSPALTTPQLVSYYVFPFLISLVFIKFPLTLAKVVVPRSSEQSSELSGDSGSIQLAGFIILGVYLVANAIPDFLHNLMLIFSYSRSESRLELPGLYAAELATVIEAAVGLYLVLGAKGLVRLLHRFRNAGLG